MRYTAQIVVIIFTVALAGCDYPSETKNKDYKIVLSGSNSEALLLNQTTGESWRLTEAGWRPILSLPKASEKHDDEVQRIEAELARRKQIYHLLAQSEAAKKIAADLELGAINQAEARASLKELLPQYLGPLPPDAEKGKWNKR
jgi:hypothetical protein